MPQYIGNEWVGGTQQTAYLAHIKFLHIQRWTNSRVHWHAHIHSVPFNGHNV